MQAEKRFSVRHRAYLAEFLGTALMLLNGFSAIIFFSGVGSPMPQAIPDPDLRLLLTACAFAGGATLVIYSPLGKKSGGHINPAVSLAFLLQKKLSWRDFLWYVLAQISGGVAGTFLVSLLWGEWANSVDVGMTKLRSGLPVASGFALEAGMTAALVLVVFFMTSLKKISKLTGIAAGALVAFFVFVEAPLTGTGINPARSLAPAIVGGNYAHIGLYLTAPMFGAAFAVGIFRLLGGRYSPLCGKLNHPERDPDCHFLHCAYRKQAVKSSTRSGLSG